MAVSPPTPRTRISTTSIAPSPFRVATHARNQPTHLPGEASGGPLPAPRLPQDSTYLDLTMDDGRWTMDEALTRERAA